MILHVFQDLYDKSKKLYGVMRAYKLLFIPGVILEASQSLMLMMLMAYTMGNATTAIQQGDLSKLARIIASALGFYLVIIGIQAFSGYLLDIATVKATASLRKQVFQKLINAPLLTAVNEHSGVKLSYLMNDVPAAMGSLRQTFVLPLSCLLTGVGGLWYLAWLDARLALLTVGLGLISFTYSVFFAQGMRRAGDRVQTALAESSSYLKDLMDGISTVRVFQLVGKLRQRFDLSAHAAMKAGLSRAWMSAALGGVNNFHSHFGTRVIVFAGGFLAFGGSIELSDLMRVSNVATDVFGIFAFARLLAEVQGAMAGAQRVFDVIGIPGEILGKARIGTEGTDAISFDNVSFAYKPSQPVMQNTSFTIKKGEMVALTGESGCGKSSILRLVQGLYTPVSGNVSVMGRNIADWEPDALRQSAALVPQDVSLFTGTVADNIRMGRIDASPQEITQAAIDSGAYDFITKLPNGFDTVITERGMSLSGGQRQRIAIARALLRNASILLLDEATSALDAESEAAVQRTFEAIKGRCTILVVAHRLSTVDIADRVLHVQTGGRIV